MKPGDVFRYGPPEWCQHGLALVAENGVAWDTYWGEHSSTRGPIAPATIKEATLLGNLKDFTTRIPYPFDFFDYEDTIFIPIGGCKEMRYVRIGAAPRREIVEHRFQNEIRSAERNVEVLKQKQLEARNAMATAQQGWTA